ncbi:hypothetical protein [Komagataeibacter nataicola]|nr:hypothetical protein [Komagataeibacter nataicola]WNM10293.1 hypothetical protein RI056_18510 [Komagataeibacter nataicola]GBR23436.1 hypothetical protein AA0616_2522 [Komagataeibacter nataicola NRIC 0616]
MTDSNVIRGVKIPTRCLGLPRLSNGMPIPKFASWKNGVADLTTMNAEYARHAMQFKTCWICGQKLGRHCAFVGGPKSAHAGVYSDFPMHRECAEFAVQVCPFIVYGSNYRKNPTLNTDDMARMVDNDNPVIFCVSVASRYRYEPSAGVFVIHPDEQLWFLHGKPATPEQIADAKNKAQAEIESQKT